MGGKRTSAAAAAALVLLGGGAAFATSGSEPQAGAAAKPRAKVLTTSQRNALRAKYVRVRVRPGARGRVRIGARARRAGGGRRYRITRIRTVRMRGSRARTLRLKLTRSGRRIVGSCRAIVIDVRGRRSTRRFTSKRRAIRRDPRRCPISAPAGGSPLGPLNTQNAATCDFLDPSLCLYPFPNDHFTVADASTPTRRRLNISSAFTPQSTKTGQRIATTDQNRADGFSPGNMIVTKVPGLNSQEAFRRTGAVPITDMERSFDPDQPVVVINARTGKRQLIWAEIDANPLTNTPPKPDDVTLIIRPGENFEEGERYIVALRRMRAADGSLLKPREEFRAYRDGIVTGNPDIEARRSKFEGIFQTLGQAGIARHDLYLTWDFTVASEKSLAGRALEMRDDAFEQLGDSSLANLTIQGDSPQFVRNADIPDAVVDGIGGIDTDPIPSVVDFGELDGVRDYAPCSAGASADCEQGESDRTARRVTGQITVPCYLDQPSCPPGSGFANGAPAQTAGNTTLANVICTIPRVALDGGGRPLQSRPSLYGHGLLGGAGEVGAGNVQAMGNEHNFVFCATDWVGMSTFDVPHVATLLQDLSRFNTLVDRIQQGYVNFMYLGRWLIHPDGAASDPAFQLGGSQSVIDRDELFYDGNSQGGILSGGLTALSPDFRAAVHGVPGMNYSTLLSRSVDFDMYATGNIEGLPLPIGLYQAYPNELERPLIFSLMQLLWDRGETNGFAQHMTDDPLPNSPAHRVLLHPAFGDHQVANVSAEVEARTIDACTNRPSLYAGRSPDVKPLFGIPTFGDAACEESGITYFDTGPLRTVNGDSKGTPPPPTTNVPPRAGNDPHGAPRNDAKGRIQKSNFLSVGGGLTNVCGPLPCFADGFTGP